MAFASEHSLRLGRPWSVVRAAPALSAIRGLRLIPPRPRPQPVPRSVRGKPSRYRIAHGQARKSRTARVAEAAVHWPLARPFGYDGDMDTTPKRPWYRLHWRTVLILLGLSAVTAPPAFPADVMTILREDSVDKIGGLLRSLPDWPCLPEDGGEKSVAEANADADELERIMEQIATFDTDSLREAVVRYYREIHSRRTKAVEEHLILLNKFLFNLPERVPRGSRHFEMLCQGGNLGGRKKVVADAQLFGFNSDELPARWPWYEDFDGRWRFWVTRGMNGALITFGPPYAAVEVFDYCLREFGRREIRADGSPAQ